MKQELKYEEELIKIKITDKNNKINIVQKMQENLRNNNKELRDEQSLILKVKTQFEEELKTCNEMIKNLDSKKDAALNIIFEHKKKYLKIYNKQNNIVVENIKLTDVDENNIPQFLILIDDGLLPATLVNQMQTDQLAIKFQTFGDLMKMICSSSLLIKDYCKLPKIDLDRIRIFL